MYKFAMDVNDRSLLYPFTTKVFLLISQPKHIFCINSYIKSEVIFLKS